MLSTKSEPVFHIQNFEKNVAPSNVITPRPILSKPEDNTHELLNYFWITIDESKFPNISLPCLYRQTNGEKIKYLSVRLIENTILSQFANMDSDEIKKHGSLLSVRCQSAEVDLLNEISKNHSNYGVSFNTNDSLVKLEDFQKFYQILINTCPLKGSSFTINNKPVEKISNQSNSKTILTLQNQNQLNKTKIVTIAQLQQQKQ